MDLLVYWYNFLLLSTYNVLIYASNNCYNNKRHGDLWNITPCETCECNNGKIYCKTTCKEDLSSSAFLLREKLNSNVIKVTSDYCTHNGHMMKDEQSWHETGIHASSLDGKNECMQCQCNRGIVTCTIRTCPTISCRNPRTQEGTCCKACPKGISSNSQQLTRSKACFQSGSLFSEYSSWKMYIPVKKKLGRCLQCSCTKSNGRYNHVCKQLKCPALTCENPIGKLGQCCGTCKGSRSRGSIDDDFRRSNMMTIDMLLENGLSSSNARASTDLLPQPSIGEKTMEKISNLDCDQFGNKVYRHNERFIPEISTCLRCLCRNSKVQCDKVICPSTYPCRKPELRRGLCCKTCSSTTDVQARKIEDQNVARIGKKRSTNCANQKDDRIQVYEFGTGEDPPNALKVYFLFDRSHQYRRNPSEMHLMELRGGKVHININYITEKDQQITGRWRYAGSIKDKILRRVRKHEDELKKMKSVASIIRKMDTIRKLVLEKARRRRTCKTKTIQTRETSKILQALQEVGKGR